MYTIRIANETDYEAIARLGAITYSESHGAYIENKNDLLQYNTTAFSIEKIKADLRNTNLIFYLIFIDKQPVGYAKLVFDVRHESISSKKTCRLERLYILDKYIPMKIGQPLFNTVLKKAKSLEYKSMWLSVYIKNDRAIRFYEKNKFKSVGALNFSVNGTDYKNFVLEKEI